MRFDGFTLLIDRSTVSRGRRRRGDRLRGSLAPVVEQLRQAWRRHLSLIGLDTSFSNAAARIATTEPIILSIFALLENLPLDDEAFVIGDEPPLAPEPRFEFLPRLPNRKSGPLPNPKTDTQGRRALADAHIPSDRHETRRHLLSSSRSPGRRSMNSDRCSLTYSRKRRQASAGPIFVGRSRRSASLSATSSTCAVRTLSSAWPSSRLDQVRTFN